MEMHQQHYLTVAAFRMAKTHGPNEVTIDEHMPFSAEIRKVCICGSSIEFEQESHVWLCSGSGVALNENLWNCAPLISGADFGNLDLSSLSDPHCASVMTFDENGNLITLLKIEAKDHWVISDPLPMFEHLSVKRFETDLLLRWSLHLEDPVRTGLSFELYWNLANPKDRQIVESLCSLQSTQIYFVDADSLSVIASKVLELHQPAIQSAAKQAFALIAALPQDESERREQLSAISLGQEASMFNFAEQMGMCPVVIGYMLASSLSHEKVTEMSQHLKDCPICQKSSL